MYKLFISDCNKHIKYILDLWNLMLQNNITD